MKKLKKKIKKNEEEESCYRNGGTLALKLIWRKGSTLCWLSGLLKLGIQHQPQHVLNSNSFACLGI